MLAHHPGMTELARAHNLFPHRIGDGVPDLILQLGRRRARDRHRGPVALPAGFDQPQHPDFAVGVIEVAAAIMAGDRRPNAGDLVFCRHHAGVFQVGREYRAFGIEIGADMVCDGGGVFADRSVMMAEPVPRFVKIDRRDATPEPVGEIKKISFSDFIVL